LITFSGNQEVIVRPFLIRVGRDDSGSGKDSSTYLDLGDPSGRAVKIGTDGRSVVARPCVHFRRPQGLLPLPLPSRDGSIELLRSYVNLTEADFHLLIGWLAAALRPLGPYPVLLLHGEQGSAKSTLARIVRLLIDPWAPSLLAEPRSLRDLMITALNGWLLVFDNISAVPAWLSDGLCRLATGGGFATRTLFSNDKQSVIDAQRPVVLNGIEDFVRRGGTRGTQGPGRPRRLPAPAADHPEQPTRRGGLVGVVPPRLPEDLRRRARRGRGGLARAVLNPTEGITPHV
jgi:hypothetical protein